MRAEALREIAVLAFGEQVDVELAEQRPEGIRVLGLLDRPAPIDAQQIGTRTGARARRTGRLLRIGLSVGPQARLVARDAVTAKAPGSITRTTSPDAVRCRPSTAKGSRLRPSMTACSAGARRRSSSIGASSTGGDDPGRDARQTVQRNAEPGRPVGGLVADFVGRLFHAGTGRAAPARSASVTHCRALSRMTDTVRREKGCRCVVGEPVEHRGLVRRRIAPGPRRGRRRRRRHSRTSATAPRHRAAGWSWRAVPPAGEPARPRSR